MSDMYCVYRGGKYKIKKRNGGYIIVSKESKAGFTKYVDVLGNEHDDFFMKYVSEHELECIYFEKHYIKYNNEYFSLFSSKITRDMVLDDSFMIWTNSEQLAREHDFEKKEQFVFVKFIKRREIEAIKIVKKPLQSFEATGEFEEIIEGTEVDNYLDKLIDDRDINYTN